MKTRRSRLITIISVFILTLVIIISRLFYLYFEDSGFLQNKGKLKLITSRKISSIRGQILDKNNNATFIQLNPITGRKHQLRKQLFNLGNSIIGDKKYNSTNNSKINNKNLMLHSYEIKFKINEKKYTFRATPPDYFRNMLKIKRLNF